MSERTAELEHVYTYATGESPQLYDWVIHPTSSLTVERQVLAVIRSTWVELRTGYTCRLDGDGREYWCSGLQFVRRGTAPANA